MAEAAGDGPDVVVRAGHLVIVQVGDCALVGAVEPVTKAGAWVRSGDRWAVTARHHDGSLAVGSLTGRGHVTLPGDYWPRRWPSRTPSPCTRLRG